MSTEEVKSNIDYTFINEWLEYGQRQEIALKHKLTAQTGYKILGKSGFHKAFLEDCYKAAFENCHKWIAQKEQAKILKQKIASLYE